MTTSLVARILAGSLAVVCIGAMIPTEKAAGPQLAHAVYFTLKDKSPKATEAFLATCEKYLTSHKGAVFYTVGTMAHDVLEPVSDRDFDVALHVVFESKKALEAYLKSERHDKFVQANKETFAKVRVFDSYVIEMK